MTTVQFRFNHFRQYVKITIINRFNNTSTTHISTELSTISTRLDNTKSTNYQYLYRSILNIIQCFRDRGHYAAHLDPLKQDASCSCIGHDFDASYSNGKIPDIVQFLYNYNRNQIDGSHSGSSSSSNSSKYAAESFDAICQQYDYDLSVFIDKDKIHDVNCIMDKALFNIHDLNLYNVCSSSSSNSHSKSSNNGCDSSGSKSSSNVMYYSFHQIIEALIRTYCNKVGIEISHIEDPQQKQWLLQQIERQMMTQYSSSSSRWCQATKTQQLENINRLIKVDHSASFIKKKYPSSKVFGIEGCESLIPGIWALLQRGCFKWGLEGLELGKWVG